MVQVPRFTTVDYQPGSMVPLQAPSPTPVRDFSPQQMDAVAQGLQGLGAAAVRTDVLQQRMQEQEQIKQQRMQNQLDDARTKEAYNQLYDYSTNIFAGKDVGYRYKLGNAAITSYKGTREDLDKKFREIEDSLDNDVQKQMFRASAGRYMRGVVTDMDSHYEAQHKNYVQAQSVARAENLNQSASDSYMSYLRESTPMGDPMDAAQFLKDYNDYKKALLTEVEQIADMNGASPEVKQDALGKARTGLHSNIVQALIADKRPDEAVKYLEANAAEIQDPARTQLQERVGQSGILQQSELVAAEARKLGTLKERTEYVNKLFADRRIPAEVKQSATNIVKAEYQIDSLDIERRRSESLGVVVGWINANRGMPLEMAPEEIRKTVSDWGLQSDVKKAIDSSQESGFSDALMKVRWMAQNDPQALAMNTPDGRPNMTLEKFRSTYSVLMPPEDYKKAESYWDAVNGISRGGAMPASEYTEMVIQGAYDAGVITTPPGTKITSAEERAKLNEFQRSIDLQRANLGGNLDAQTLQTKVIDATALRYRQQMQQEGPILFIKDYGAPSQYTPAQQMAGAVTASQMKDAYIQVGTKKIFWAQSPALDRTDVIEESDKLRLARGLRLEGAPATPANIMMALFAEKAKKSAVKIPYRP